MSEDHGHRSIEAFHHNENLTQQADHEVFGVDAEEAPDLRHVSSRNSTKALLSVSILQLPGDLL